MWTFFSPLLDFFWCNSYWESSHQNAHSETVCDRHLQQAHSGADGLPHRVSKPQRVCVCVCVPVCVCLLTKSTLWGVQLSHMKELMQNLTVEGPFLGGHVAFK